MGKGPVKWGVAALRRRLWVGARQGRRQREVRLRRRVDMERRCTWGAVGWKWDIVAFGRRRWIASERGAAAEGAALCDCRRLDGVLCRFWEAPMGRQ